MNEAARAATPDDITEIVRLARALRDELRPQRGAALWELRDARPRAADGNSVALLLTSVDTAVVVGTLDDVVVGYGWIQYEQLPDSRVLGVIHEIYVEPDARDVGVGEAIMAALLGDARANRCAAVDAYALPGDRAAKNFFERAGLTARLLTMHKPL